MKYLAQATSQVRFRYSFRRNKQFSEAHSAGTCSVRVGSSTPAAAPRAIWFLDACQRSSDCALPHDSAREKGGSYNTMKTPIRHGKSANKKVGTTPRVSQTVENGRSKCGSSLATQGERIRRCLGMFAAALLVILLNGCASVATSAAHEPWQFNPNTGYPAVGGPSCGRI